MPAEASLTPARLLPGKEELLVHILSHSPIQDVKDRVTLGEQLHLTKRGCPQRLCLAGIVGAQPAVGARPAGATAQHLCCECNKGTSTGMGTVSASAQ